MRWHRLLSANFRRKHRPQLPQPPEGKPYYLTPRLSWHHIIDMRLKKVTSEKGLLPLYLGSMAPLAAGRQQNRYPQLSASRVQLRYVPVDVVFNASH